MNAFPAQNALGSRHRRHQRVQRCKNGGNAWQKSMIEIDAPQVALKTNFSCRLLHRLDGVKLRWDRDQARGRDSVAEERDLGSSQDTFFSVQCQSSGEQTGKNHVQMLGVSVSIR